MKLTELKNQIDTLVERNKYAHEVEVVISITLPYATVGGSPFSEVKDLFSGFDWDKGKLFICPKEDLTISDAKVKEVVSKMHKQLGDLHYENSGLKSEIKRLRKAQEK